MTDSTNGGSASTSEELIEFLGRYTYLLEQQLVAVRDTMATTVESVMEGVSQISSATEERRKEAEKTLEDTYLNPDPETQVLVDSVQETVSTLFDAISDQIKKGGNPGELQNLQPEVIIRNRIKRFSAKFTNHIKALGALDNELGILLLGMIGSLSSDDVIAQRIEHVSTSLNALEIGLNYFLLDFENRCRPSDISAFIQDLASYTKKQYTMQEEHAAFEAVFPHLQPKKAS